MTKKNNGLDGQGRAQPEIELNSRWKDNWGEKITVKRVEFGRITYVRDGYDRECVCSEYRFRNDFSYLPEESARSEETAKKFAREKIAAIRSSLPLSVGSDGFDKELK